jgi:hypothetical protein
MLRAAASVARIFYYVTLTDGQWEVRYDGQEDSVRYRYVSQQAALDAATAAAKSHWEERQPSGVRLERRPGAWHDYRLFGKGRVAD